MDVSPNSVIHDMLTYIGVAIMAKMFFSMVGVIPEVHSAKAVDQIDVYGRHSNISKDIRGVGIPRLQH
ncbi:MAG: hypothetical protein ACU4EQ_11070 [Candidatus Nitrosoglobus sp.]